MKKLILSIIVLTTLVLANTSLKNQQADLDSKISKNLIALR